MHLTSPRTKIPGTGKPAEEAARPHSCARPSAQVSGLQSPQAEGCGRRACPEVALGLPLEIPSLLGAVGTSEPLCSASMGHSALGSGGQWPHYAGKQCPSWAPQWLLSRGWRVPPGLRHRSPDTAIRGQARVTLHTLFLLPGMY